MRSRLALSWIAAALLWQGCGGGESPSLVRLGDLLPRASPQKRTVARDLTLSGPPQVLRAAMEAPQVATLEVRAVGDAAYLGVSWRLEGEETFAPRRSRIVVLKPDREEHLYTVELQGNRAWGGRIADLRLTVDQGTVRIRELAAVVPGSPYRDLELGGLLVPSIAGQDRIEIPLPPAPGRANFETRLGLLPVLAGTDTTARFRAWVEGDGGKVPWLETTISSTQAEGWQLVRRQVEIPRRSILVLEAEVRRAGELLAPQLAFWGNPMLVFEPQDPGLGLLVLAVDTLRADVLGAYGDEAGLTPHIDELARRSVRFTDLTAPAPWTLPSFASLLTGLQPQTHGAGRNLTGNVRLRQAPISRLDPGFATLPRLLSDSGFFTAGFYTNPYLGPAFGLHRDFDEYQGFEAEVRAGPVVDRAIAALARAGDRRFLLFVHLLDAHTPYHPPARYCQQIARRLEPAVESSVPCRVIRSPHRETIPRAQRPWARALYRAEVAYLDRQIGRLLAALDEHGLDRRTVVLLVSDHGEEFWEHQEQERSLGYHAIADHGHSHYQELLHVPAVLSVPGQIPGAVRAPVEMVDLFPTVLRYLGIEPPPSQGRDLGPLIAGRSLPEPLRISDFLLYGSDRWAVRRGPWKLVVKPGENPVVELYHLQEDPGETDDRSAAQGRLIAALRQEAEAELSAREQLRRVLTGNAGGDQPVQLDEDQIESLRALGYLL